MGEIFTILRFGRPYLRRYWLRFALGILFGFIFGLSNGLTLGGIGLMLGRLGDTTHVKKQAVAEVDTATPKAESETSKSIHATLKTLGNDINTFVDPWLPLANRPLDWKQLLGGLLIFPLLSTFRGLMNYLTNYLMAWSGQRISNDIKEDVFRKINSLSLSFFHRHNTAELMSRINDDTAALNTCLRIGLSDLIKEPSTIVCLFVGLLLIDWKLTVIALAFAPLCLIPTRIVTKKIKEQGRQDNSASVMQGAIAMESFQNVRVTKAYELADEHARLFRISGNMVSRAVMKTVQARAMLNPIIETLNSIGIGAVLIYAIWAGVSIKVLGSFLIALVFFLVPFKKLSMVHAYFTQAALSVERLMDLFKEVSEVPDPKNPVPMTAFSKSLEFRNLQFSYGHDLVLDNVSFSLPRGRRLGLAGESGSGKSSLLNLAFRFYDPTGGTIEMDGKSIDTLRLADLRSQLALVSQDVLLFNATVAENIAFGKIGASREEIVTAAKEAYAHDFIMGLPQGYETPLGEHGVRLSGGQRQRIAIARAFVRNAPILVLDEATAALDSQAEAEVQKAIDHLAEHRTVICVAHRLSTLRTMDEILVLQKGKIVEQGGFEELLAKKGLFASMAARQSIYASEERADNLTAAVAGVS